MVSMWDFHWETMMVNQMDSLTDHRMAEKKVHLTVPRSA
jgi:hypothetical protein